MVVSGDCVDLMCKLHYITINKRFSTITDTKFPVILAQVVIWLMFNSLYRTIRSSFTVYVSK